MKLLYIHQHFSTPAGSTGTRSYEFARRLVRQGHEVVIICGSFSAGHTGLTTAFIKNSRQGMVDGIHIIETGIPYSNRQNFFFRTKQFIHFAYKASILSLKLPYDLIYATTTPLTVAIPALIAKFFRRKSYIFEVRDLWPELPKAMGVITNPLILKSMEIIEKCAYKYAAHCVALSLGIEQGIAKKINKKNNISLIPNGSDVHYFSEGIPSILPGFNQSDFICVFTGAHGLANGLDAVLDVASVLISRNPAIKFLFIGDGKLKPHLIKRKNDEKLDNCIFWNQMPKDEIKHVLKSVQLGLMILQNIPAFYDGTSPNKFFDYIAAGLPVINNYPGWIKCLIEQHACGVFVEPNNIKNFADTLLALTADREKLKLMGKRARNLAIEKFDRDFLAEKFIRVVEDVYVKTVI